MTNMNIVLLVIGIISGQMGFGQMTKTESTNKELAEEFYSAFSRGDYETMINLYHPNATFYDPVFLDLNSLEVKSMWKMLVMGARDLTIDFHSVQADGDLVNLIWEARYTFSKTGRNVHNVISTEIEFKDGLIIKHRDHFSFWKWSSMALGTTGRLLGWTPFLKGKVQNESRRKLNKFMAHHTEAP